MLGGGETLTAAVSHECKRLQGCQSEQLFEDPWKCDLTHGVTVHQQDTVSVGAPLQTHVEGMHSVGIHFILSHKKEAVKTKRQESHVC